MRGVGGSLILMIWCRMRPTQPEPGETIALTSRTVEGALRRVRQQRGLDVDDSRDGHESCSSARRDAAAARSSRGSSAACRAPSRSVSSAGCGRTASCATARADAVAVPRVSVLDRGRKARVRRLGPGRRRPGQRPSAPGDPQSPDPRAAHPADGRRSQTTSTSTSPCSHPSTPASPPRAAGAVIIDNSKQPEIALLARRTPGVDLSVLHLVRRSHGVAYSWTKHVKRSPTRPAARCCASPRAGPQPPGCSTTLCSRLIGRTGTPRLQMRYEDFVAGAARAHPRGRGLPRPRHPRRADAVRRTDRGAARDRSQRVGQPHAAADRRHPDAARRGMARRACRPEPDGRSRPSPGRGC